MSPEVVASLLTSCTFYIRAFFFCKVTGLVLFREADEWRARMAISTSLGSVSKVEVTTLDVAIEMRGPAFFPIA